MCLFFKATRILSFCIPVTNTHFGIKLTRCFPGPRDAATPFCLLAGCGEGPSCTRRLWEPNTHRLSCVRELVPGGSQNLHSHSWTAAPVFHFFSSKVWGQEEEGGRMTVHFSGDAAMRILEGRADSVCQKGWSTGTGLSAPLQLCPGLRRLHPPQRHSAPGTGRPPREVSGCPGRGRAAGAVGGPDPHPAVLVSTCSCRREPQQLETVNSLSIIILHITQV